MEAFSLKQITFPNKLTVPDHNPDEISTTVLLLKRSLDIIGSLTGLILFCPVILAVSLAIKLTSPGPVFFHQRRVGHNGKIFSLIKFRSMKINAEGETGAVWAEEGKGKSDPRVTPIGDFLRKSHLDEIPQLFLVLMGSMSLVGPRPERPEFEGKLDKEFVYFKERTTNLKPGVTGIAQLTREVDPNFQVTAEKRSTHQAGNLILSEKSLRETNDKLLADHTYGIFLTRASLLGVILLDLKIMIITVLNIFRKI